MLDNDMIYRYARVRLEQLVQLDDECIASRIADGRKVPGAILEVRDMHKKDLEEINELIINLTK